MSAPFKHPDVWVITYKFGKHQRPIRGRLAVISDTKSGAIALYMNHWPGDTWARRYKACGERASKVSIVPRS